MMGSEIPVIDLSDEGLKQRGSASWLSACERVRYALQEYGCFEAIYGRQLPPELNNSMFDTARELFELPVDTKMQRTTLKPGPNYVGQNPSFPLYEAIAVESPETRHGAQRFTKIMWPDGNDRFCDTLSSFAKIMAEQYESATRLIFESYGVAELHEQHMDRVSNRIRFFKYASPENGESSLGLTNHTDKTFVTLIHQHQIEGLQVKTRDGRYVDVQPKSSSFLFLAGDFLKAWSNDRIHACEHRVMIKRARYSLGFQSFIDGLCDVPQHFVDQHNPLRYNPIHHFDFLARLSVDQSLQKSPCSVKDYAGIN